MRSIRNKIKSRNYSIVSQSIVPGQGNYVVFDTETTGFGNIRDDIIQFSMIDGNNNTLVDNRYKPYKPETQKYEKDRKTGLYLKDDQGNKVRRPMTWEVHGVLPETTMNKPLFSNSLEDVIDHFRKADYIVGHNVYYDLKMTFGAIQHKIDMCLMDIAKLANEKDNYVFESHYDAKMQEIQYQLALAEEFKTLIQSKPIIDTLPEWREFYSSELGRKLVKGEAKLGNVAEYIKQHVDKFKNFTFNAHDSLEDIKATNVVFLGMLELGWKFTPKKFRFEKEYEELVDYVDAETGEKRQFNTLKRDFSLNKWED